MAKQVQAAESSGTVLQAFAFVGFGWSNFQQEILKFFFKNA
jgi:hypothetical protein